jgi:hypothetical protein
MNFDTILASSHAMVESYESWSIDDSRQPCDQIVCPIVSLSDDGSTIETDGCPVVIGQLTDDPYIQDSGFCLSSGRNRIIVTINETLNCDVHFFIEKVTLQCLRLCEQIQ